MELKDHWQASYYLSKRKTDCDDIVNLRTQIYHFCEENGLAKMMPAEMEHELDLIGEQLIADKKIAYNRFNNSMMPTAPTTNNLARKLMIPTLGSIYENQIEELPSPDMVHIEDDEFDDEGTRKRVPLRKEYSTTDLRMICPNLYQHGKKADVIKNVLDEIDILGQIKETKAKGDDEKQNLRLRMRLK